MKRTRWGQLDPSLSLRFILPVVWENGLTIAVGLIFSQIISGISGSALAAIGMANTVMMVAFAIFSMVTTGASVLVSRQIGEGDRMGAAGAVEQTLFLSLVSSLAVMALCVAGAGPILRLLMPTAEEQLFGEAVRYFIILMLSLPAYVLHSALSTITRATGDSRNPLYVAVAMNGVQLLAGFLLISLLGLEEVGAGLAYVICRLAGAGLMLWVVCRGPFRHILRLKNALRPRMGVILRILHIGVPVSLESIFVQVGYMLGNSMSIALGTFEAGVYQVLNTVNTFITVGQPICATVALSAVGHLLGAGKAREARQGGMYVWTLGMVGTLGLSAVVLLLGHPLAGLYSSDPATVSASVSCLWLLVVMDIAGLSINAIDSQLRAGGDVRYVMAVSLSAVWLIRLPLTWLFCFVWDLGVPGIFLANTISLYYRAVMGLVRYRGTRWMKRV